MKTRALAAGLAALLGTSALAQDVTFADIDTNDDGFLEPTELRTAFGNQAQGALNSLDRDGDGLVSLEEVVARQEDDDDDDDDLDEDDEDDDDDDGDGPSARGLEARELKGDNRSERGATASQAGGNNRSDRGTERSNNGGGNGNRGNGNGRN
ncbi:EF-hand domain-containing protein [Histidinibacterium aquaticum]|uniref:EF-hand domain-containing protein n=1 Tax=Histidinibacterium aquaticum TaxID=2613962 RepID=A0A5J5GJ78_9RHOB|nr:hypothetical protein [Histidinibacterium aquaticum]KAA9007793.1 hypothetical protein F3S47_09700 [Histidinibacterium aquaticum]